MADGSIPEKACSVCRAVYPATRQFFFAQSRGMYGVRSVCKGCGNAAQNAAYRKRRTTLACSVTGCGGGVHVLKYGLCPGHLGRLRKHGDVLADKPIRKHSGRSGKGYLNRFGYRMLSRKRGENKFRPRFEHRVVMEAHLGRALLQSESVHHKNGIRSDNRIENLELWIRRQPSGQRVPDLIMWAKEILARYGDNPEKY